MKINRPTLVIMAAGMGSRYGGLKQIDGLGPQGETLMEYAIYDALKAGFGKIVFIIRKNMQSVFDGVFNKKLLSHIPYELVFQELYDLPGNFKAPDNRAKPWGTAHAVWVCRNVVNTPFTVINADDFYGREAYQNVADYFNHNNNPLAYAMNAYQLDKTLSDFGGVTRGICQVDSDNQLTKVDEHLRLTRNAKGVVESMLSDKTIEIDPKSPVSMNIWAFYPTVFELLEQYLIEFLEKNLHEPKAEAYTPAFVDAMILQQKASVKVLTSSAKWFGVTYSEDKARVQSVLQKLIDQGTYPTPLFELK